MTVLGGEFESTFDLRVMQMGTRMLIRILLLLLFCLLFMELRIRFFKKEMVTG